MNQKEIRIRKLHEKGMHDPSDIARKIGYNGKTLDEGICSVKEALEKARITEKQDVCTKSST